MKIETDEDIRNLREECKNLLLKDINTNERGDIYEEFEEEDVGDRSITTIINVSRANFLHGTIEFARTNERKMC